MMNENSEPDWLAALARSGEALRRQVEPIIQAAEQFVHDARRAKTNGGPVLPFAQRVALAVDAGMRELLPTPLHAVVHQETLELSVVFPTPTVITGSGGLTLPRISIGGQGTVEDRRGWFAGMSAGQILAVVLVWLVAYALPIYLYSQSPTPSTLINADVATFAFAYTITCQVIAKRK